MKKYYAIFAITFLIKNVMSQNFSDNFESYTVGAYLGPQSALWTTFSGFGQGSSEDVLITDLVTSSGAKSIYFASTQLGGGPQDVVLDFQTTHSSGIFTFESKFYVLPGKKASFSFQKNATLGSGHALEVFMANGNMLIQNLGSNLLAISYPEGSWFTLTFNCNLTTKIWEVKVNGISAGKWINPTNTIHFLEIYPTQTSQFVMDDVSYAHIPYTLPLTNAATANLSLDGLVVAQTVIPTLKVVNAGTTTINSFDAVLNYNGLNYTENISGINLSTGTAMDVNFSNLSLVSGSNNALATVSNVNGAMDDDLTDNSSNQIIHPITPAFGKIVVSEEGTGTWCEWCPRGTVAMGSFESKYPTYWAGIAVHRNDPMTTTIYDQGMSFVGFPSAKVNRRGVEIDPNQMTSPFLTELQIEPKAIIEVGATFDSGTGELNVSGDFIFQSAAANGYKAAFVITEDEVVGTTIGYNQNNAYSGGGNGPMGGYELLSNPVPAAQMIYNHVARVIAPSFGGYAQSFPMVITNGSSHVVNHKFFIPASWNAANLNLIVLLIAPNGEIDNAGKASIIEAVSNGYSLGTSTTAEVLEINEIDAAFEMYPNPATTNVALTFNLKLQSEVTLKVLDMSGKILANRDYDSMNGVSQINFNTTELNSGIYHVEVTINSEKVTKRLVIL